MAPMTNADESPTNHLTLFWLNISLFIVSTLWYDQQPTHASFKHIFSIFSQIQEKTCHCTITYRPLSIDPRRKLKRLADMWHCCFQDWSLFFCCAVNAWCIKTKTDNIFLCYYAIHISLYPKRHTIFFSLFTTRQSVFG